MRRWFSKVRGGDVECAYSPPPTASAFTLVLLHDALGCIDTWSTFPADLARQCDVGVFVFSRPGHGRSACPHGRRGIDYMHIQAEQVLPDVLTCVKLGRFVLVGHSDGAAISLIHAANCPRKELAGMVLLAPHVRYEPYFEPALLEAQRQYAAGELTARLRLFHGGNADHVFRSWNDTWLSPSFRSWDIRSVLPEVRVPVLLVCGQRDEFGSSEQLSKIAAGLKGPSQHVCMADAGHAPHHDQMPEVVRAIDQFLRQLDSHD